MSGSRLVFILLGDSQGKPGIEKCQKSDAKTNAFTDHLIR